MATLRVFASFSLLFAALGAAQSPSEITFEGLGASNPAPTFDHGYVAAWDLLHVHSVSLYNPEGRKMFELSSLTLPDGTTTPAPISVAVDTDGTSAMVYWVEHDPRTGIALLDDRGHQLRVIQTQPFLPSQVCFAPDHSIWTFGDQAKQNHRPVPDFMTFRHYSRNGELLGSFIPRSSLPQWEGMGEDQVLGKFIGLWRLRASNDRIGAALRTDALKHLWIELNLQGQLIGQWAYTSNRDESVFPSAFDAAGSLYGRQWKDGGYVGISLFDKSTSSWKPLPSLPNELLLGADGTRLVFQYGDRVQWIQGPNTERTESASLTQP
jgi:hypothetical protein